MRQWDEIYGALNNRLRNKNIEVERLKENNIYLKKYIEILTSIIRISNYINSHLLDEDLIQVINNMIIEIISVSYSSIFLVEDNELIMKGSNIKDIEFKFTSEEITNINNKKSFIINSEDVIKELEDGKKIRSIIGIPIILTDEFMGYIILSDDRYGFLDKDIKLFLESIAIQIANSIKNSRVYKELDILTKRDSFLNIYNRRYFFRLLEENSHKKKFALVMMDIDDFKKINDTYGHQLGDEVLKSTVKLIKSWLEEDDIIARYGGEEFALYIPNFQDKESVYNKIDIMRKSIERNVIRYNDIHISITASFGIAFAPIDGTNVNDLVKIADDLLYNSKESGKNKILTTYIKKPK